MSQCRRYRGRLSALDCQVLTGLTRLGAISSTSSVAYSSFASGIHSYITVAKFFGFICITMGSSLQPM
jgi:hypothetical protein